MRRWGAETSRKMEPSFGTLRSVGFFVIATLRGRHSSALFLLLSQKRSRLGKVLYFRENDMPYTEPEFLPSRPSECVCKGIYKKRKYWKDEEKKEMGTVEVYCPMCHPNLASPFIPNPGQVEITKEEFQNLCLSSGWSMHAVHPPAEGPWFKK